MVKLKQRIFFLPLMLLLTGCPGVYGDYVYGVSRSANLEKVPSMDCVRESIASAPGVVSVKFNESTGGRPLTWSGIKAPNKIYNFIFSGSAGSDISGTLQITKNYKSQVLLDETLIAMGGPPPPEELNATLPVMKNIERNLAIQCGLSNLPSKIAQSSI
jgi:hypothetical protein